ncbi:MAG: helix-turn-helix transcriptional regulator [Lachnospiraceae bacterium]|nr:helix-turn-helix transcriptional regulator [Lachnospiraceae bacterium]
MNKLANLSGISQSYLRDVELGKKKLTVLLLIEICNSLEISLIDFFSDKSVQTLDDDPLMQKIYKLSSEQRKSLLAFLNTL